MLVFGKKFQSVRALWEDECCLCPTLKILKQRLLKYNPERACIPSWWTVWGVRFKDLFEVSKDSRCEVPYSVLLKRVGRKMPIQKAVKRKYNSPGEVNGQWRRWLDLETIKNQECIILKPSVSMSAQLACQFYVAMEKGIKIAVDQNLCGQPRCINPDHYKTYKVAQLL